MGTATDDRADKHPLPADRPLPTVLLISNDTHNRNSSRIFVNSNELYVGTRHNTYMQSIYLPFAMLSHRGS